MKTCGYCCSEAKVCRHCGRVQMEHLSTFRDYQLQSQAIREEVARSLVPQSSEPGHDDSG